ncbi:KTSC domain-containing protein [Spiribacter sp. C176]|uniref:KTSC domain-containing protein n=2 Tax=Spiribacter salilacus TaxID=2664894 RepID=A0A6N7QVA3_9GAMM|nr:KTSC domain-containing protein [Spiribacter salilacus]
MQSVSSKAIDAIGYDPTTQRLRIIFRQGRTYDYCGVPAHIYEQFLRAASKGGFFNTHIDGRYQC